MGKFLDEFKKSMQNALPARKPDRAEEPAGFASYQRMKRKQDRRINYARTLLEGADISLEDTMAALKATMGEEEAGKILETEKEGRHMQESLADYFRTHAQKYENLADDQKKKLQKPGYGMLAIVDELRQQNLFADDDYNKILAGTIRMSIRSLTAQQQEKFVEELENRQPEKTAALGVALENYVDPTDLKEEERYEYPYAEKINQLKEQEPDNIKNDLEKHARYIAALDWADDHLKEVKQSVRSEWGEREREDHQSIEAGYTAKLKNDNIAGYKNGLYNRKIIKEPSDVIINYIPPENEAAFQELKKDKVRLSAQTKQGISKMILKMDQMNLIGDGPIDGEDGGKVYSFRQILSCRRELQDAIQGGDPEEILKKTEAYRKATEDMEELYQIARDHFNTNEYFFPGNMDSVRNNAVPFELAGDLKTTAQVNTVFLIYCKLGKGAKGLDKYLESPTGKIVEDTFQQIKPFTYEELCKDVKSYEDALDLLTDTGKFANASNNLVRATQTYGTARAVVGPSLLEKDQNVLAGNIIYAQTVTELNAAITYAQSNKIGYLKARDRDPVRRNAKVKTLVNLLILPDPAGSMSKIFGDAPETDMYGHRVGDCIDPAAYMKDHQIDYDLVIERGNMLMQKKSVVFRTEDAVELLQEAYLYILREKQNMMCTDGYEKLRAQIAGLAAKVPKDQSVAAEKRQRVLTNISDRNAKYLDEYDEKMNSYLQYKQGIEKAGKGIEDLKRREDDGRIRITAEELKAVAIRIYPADMSYNKVTAEGLGAVMEGAESSARNIKRDLKDPTFRAYVTSLIVNGKKDYLEDGGNLADDWNQYKAAAEAEKAAFDEEPVNPRFLGEQQPNDNRADYKRTRNALVAEISQSMENRLQEKARLSGTDYLLGTDIVIWGILKDGAMQRRFLDEDAGFYENGEFKRGELNNALDQVRKQLISDKIFLKLLAEHPSPETLYDDYKKAVRQEVNKRIAKKKARDNEAKRDRAKATQRNEAKSGVTLTLSEDLKKALKDAHETLERLNRDHGESDQMKKLMDALKEVKGKDTVTMKQLEKVNDCALIYHKDRQGIFFSPFTDYGKLRLDTVEKLVRKTDKALKEPRKNVEAGLQAGMVM